MEERDKNHNKKHPSGKNMHNSPQPSEDKKGAGHDGMAKRGGTRPMAEKEIDQHQAKMHKHHTSHQGQQHQEKGMHMERMHGQYKFIYTCS